MNHHINKDTSFIVHGILTGKGFNLNIIEQKSNFENSSRYYSHQKFSMSKKINSPENEINHLYNNSSIQSPSGFPEGYLPMIDEPIDLGSFQSIDDKEFQAKINNENLPPLVNWSKEYSLKQSEIKITE